MPENREDTEKLVGIIENITYRNEENYYTVANIKSGNAHTVAVGYLPFAAVGDSVTLYGKYTVHQSYGEQFSVDKFERSVPENSAAILRYLSSGAIKGIGPSTAAKIVEKFKEKTLEILKDFPEELSVIKGISPEKALAYSEEYKKQFGVQDIIFMLSPYEISIEKCSLIFKKLKAGAVDKIKANPYILCDDNIGVSFEKAEIIAQNLGFAYDCFDRISAGIIYILRKNLQNGHTCLPEDKLVSVAQRLLMVEKEKITGSLDILVENLRLMLYKKESENFYALPEQYYAELYISARLKSNYKNIDPDFKIDDLELDYVENKIGIKFEEIQRRAVKQAFLSGVLILTGGPGTGKTTTLNAIIRIYENRNATIALAAPTGRAAKRMTELTGKEAKTIHRLLEVEWGSNDEQRFYRNERNPLDCDVIIIDEASMIDAVLFSALLKAVRSNCRIILVGDSDQLPSVGAGNILNDIIASEKFESIRLKKVFRQAGKSLIIRNAHAIINNEKADLTSKKDDFFFLKRANSNSVNNTVLELACLRLPNAYGFDPKKDIQILCPSKKFECGNVNLNNLLQSCLNPIKSGEKQMSYKGVFFRLGDKVMQIKNNYDLTWKKPNGESGTGVFNGDIGTIVAMDHAAGCFDVLFDDKTVTYFKTDLAELELAYAVTVHKSQGSEFECVILPLFDIPQKLKYRNLLYTAVTRAKKLLVIVGSERIFEEMAANDRKTLRYTLLGDFLNEDQQKN